jgi:hypothetical protein
MAAFIIGPGIKAAMDGAGDVPRSDELQVVNTEGHKIVQAYGRDALYVYYQQDNVTKRLPFG